MEEKKKFIKELTAGDIVTSFFFLEKMTLRTNRNTGQKFIELILRDKSSSILALVLANAEEKFLKISEKSVVKIRGNVGSKNNKKFLTIDKIRLITSEDEISSYDLIPSSTKTSEQILKALEFKAKHFKNIYLQRLCEFFFADEILLKKFFKAPASLEGNHNFLGGLAEHTFGVVKVCELLAEQYQNLNKELLITAAIFHKVGKIEEYIYETHLDFSEQGKLIGYIPTSLHILEKGFDKILDFPIKISSSLKHLILAQDKKFIKETLLLEAEVLQIAIEIDVLLNKPKV
ncbi:MAG: HD domain-containing protein [Calditrichaeota bacterium]|nr:MAG: HD domain-containing protein [Calditrichota bacterium]